MDILTNHLHILTIPNKDTPEPQLYTAGSEQRFELPLHVFELDSFGFAHAL